MTGLRRLASLAGMLSEEVAFSVFLVDDGSTDGTTAAVREIPMDITVTLGTGHLYWSGGMVLAYRTALASGRQFDAYLLYNDDVLLDGRFVDYIRQYLLLDGVILVGALCDPETGTTTYSGVRRIPHRTRLVFTRIEPTATLTPVDSFNGNCVLIPAKVFDALGGVDPAYAHYFGDFDLGLRATAMGVPSLLFGTVGTCRIDRPHHQRLAQAGFGERWRLLFRYPHHLRPAIYFVWKHTAHGAFPVAALLLLRTRLEQQFLVRPKLGRFKRACRGLINSRSVSRTPSDRP